MIKLSHINDLKLFAFPADLDQSLQQTHHHRFWSKVKMGKDGIMTIISELIHRLIVLKFEITHRSSY